LTKQALEWIAPAAFAAAMMRLVPGGGKNQQA
jgi:hypothetical protein